MAQEVRVTNRDRWDNRRRMAWRGITAGLGWPVFCVVASFVGAETDLMVGLTAPLYGFLAVIMAGYYGFATWDHHLERKDETERLKANVVDAD